VRFYQSRLLPHLINLSMRQPRFAAYRQCVALAAHGRVLEIGMGSGLNLPYYTDAVTEVIGLDPSARLLSMARKAARTLGRRVELLEGTAEAIPLREDSVDTIVSTWTLCSIPDPGCALREMRRVLRPDGRLLFVEHGRAPDASVRRWQDRLTPIWSRIAGGCHLNRPMDQLIEAAGFHVERMETGYIEGPRVMTFMYEGCARVARAR
jgi:ubiquinone/menaquinone biosynthesis C-methylase UbiE